MSRADKKQRHKAKREAKRRDHRRQESISPIKRLSRAPGEVECWMSDDLKGRGQLTAVVYKRGAGLSGIACFLVDRGVVGLKDAWARMNVERLEFDDIIGKFRDDVGVRRVDLEAVRRMIAGAIRWTRDHGMRLPKDWLKSVELIGGVGDIASADVSQFVKEFAGHPSDLRQRLISQPFDQFIQRKDIDFLFSNLAPYDGDGVDPFDDDEVEFDVDDFEVDDLADKDPTEDEIKLFAKASATIDKAAASVLAEHSRWLESHNEKPTPALESAWRAIISVAFMANTALPDASAVDGSEISSQFMEKALDSLAPPRKAEMEEAMEQAASFAKQSPEEFQSAMQLAIANSVRISG